MNALATLKRIWKSFSTRIPKKLQDTKYPIVYAFTVGGVRYYKFANAYNLPNKRAFSSMMIQEEFNMRCTREYLLKHLEAQDKLMSIYKDKKAGLNLGELFQLNLQLKERLEMIFEPDTAYKLASVTYFDKNEDIYDYDFEYNLKKIKFWKDNEKMSDFFLKSPLMALIPIGDLSKADFLRYLEIAEKMNGAHLERISTILSGTKRKGGL